MFDRLGSEEYEERVEDDILQAFGWAIIEFEVALYQKYLHMSGPNSVMTEEEFRKHLTRLHAKGLVSSLEFHGRRAWKKLVVETESDKPLDEESVREIFERARSASRGIGIGRRAPREKLVTESRIIAEGILDILKEKVLKGDLSDAEAAQLLLRHIEGMRRALAGSRNEFLGYVRRNLPAMETSLERILNEKGEDILLLGLRMIERGQ
ncbi:MAG: hypothetical protein EAX95_05940 [Candidatus Thorarchaeota archaeon]|nr:hypothetical protein [Candidatus Thorarchaeota archaeon]